MHTIEIKEVSEGVFDVFMNGFSYAIHRGLSADDAAKRAAAIKVSFERQGERARIIAA
jgi:sugar/nucleoside kinase (ribokinase family)